MDNKEKILHSLNKKNSQHIRELARNTSLNPMTIINYVNILEKNKVVTISKGEKSIISFAKNTKAKFERIHILIQEIIDSELISFLEEKYAYPSIILFGSAAKGEMHENSDIDICIITSDPIKVSLKAYEKKLKRTIQLFVYGKKEFNKISNELRNNILNGITLSGFFEVE